MSVSSRLLLSSSGSNATLTTLPVAAAVIAARSFIESSTSHPNPASTSATTRIAFQYFFTRKPPFRTVSKRSYRAPHGRQGALRLRQLRQWLPQNGSGSSAPLADHPRIAVDQRLVDLVPAVA